MGVVIALSKYFVDDSGRSVVLPNIGDQVTQRCKDSLLIDRNGMC